jgi:hypothetical protein
VLHVRKLEKASSVVTIGQTAGLDQGRWLLLALLFTATTRMDADREPNGSTHRSKEAARPAIKARQISRLCGCHHAVSCYTVFLRLTTIKDTNVSSKLSAERYVIGGSTTRMVMRSGATEEDNNASTTIHIEYRPGSQTDRPHPTIRQCSIYLAHIEYGCIWVTTAWPRRHLVDHTINPHLDNRESTFNTSRL